MPLRAISDAELYRRGAATLLASWAAYARGARNAALLRRPGVGIGVFPEGPERAVYNNALLDRGLGDAERAAAIEAMEAAYASAAIGRFAAWTHEGDGAMRRDLEARGYVAVEATRAMGLALSDLRAPPAAFDLEPAGWPDHVRVGALPSGLLGALGPGELHVLVGRLEGRGVATGIAFDHQGDCGIFNVGTLEPWRRRGLGLAVTARLAADAAARGCRTASLQSTVMAERVYAAAGFRDLGRFLEYQPST